MDGDLSLDLGKAHLVLTLGSLHVGHGAHYIVRLGVMRELLAVHDVVPLDQLVIQLQVLVVHRLV
jgi:hypothetical protein